MTDVLLFLKIVKISLSNWFLVATTLGILCKFRQVYQISSS